MDLNAILAAQRAAFNAELPVSLALWPVNSFKRVELSPFFDSSEAPALVDIPSPHFNTKFGGEWLSRH